MTRPAAPTHRGSGRGSHTIEDASHLDAADAARSVAIRRDRLVERQRRPYGASPTRAAEIEMLGKVYDLYRAFVDARHQHPEDAPGDLNRVEPKPVCRQ